MRTCVSPGGAGEAEQREISSTRDGSSRGCTAGTRPAHCGKGVSGPRTDVSASGLELQVRRLGSQEAKTSSRLEPHRDERRPHKDCLELCPFLVPLTSVERKPYRGGAPRHEAKLAHLARRLPPARSRVSTLATLATMAQDGLRLPCASLAPSGISRESPSGPSPTGNTGQGSSFTRTS